MYDKLGEVTVMKLIFIYYTPMQPQLFTDVALKDYNSYGKWLGGCGKYFMFSATKVA
jgi:hypothetical protein